MKLLAILCTFALYISTLSWARNLQDEEEMNNGDILEKLEKLEKYNRRARKREYQMQATIEQLVQEASERNAEIISLKSKNDKDTQHINSLENAISAISTKLESTEDNNASFQNNIHKQIEKEISSIMPNFESINDTINTNELTLEETKTISDSNKATIEEIQKEINTISNTLSNANICINDHYQKTGEYCGEWVGATLKRLPFWDDQKKWEDDINFEWPTQEIFDQMQPDVKISSIEFKYFHNYIASIKVNLSNGQSQPLFETDSAWIKQGDTIEFNQSEAFGAVTGSFFEYSACELQFYDRAGEMKYHAHSKPRQYYPQQKYEAKIEENQELIGVYGVKYGKTMKGFGFIVKEKKQTQ